MTVLNPASEPRPLEPKTLLNITWAWSWASCWAWRRVPDGAARPPVRSTDDWRRGWTRRCWHPAPWRPAPARRQTSAGRRPPPCEPCVNRETKHEPAIGEGPSHEPHRASGWCAPSAPSAPSFSGGLAHAARDRAGPRTPAPGQGALRRGRVRLGFITRTSALRVAKQDDMPHFTPSPRDQPRAGGGLPPSIRRTEEMRALRPHCRSAGTTGAGPQVAVVRARSAPRGAATSRQLAIVSRSSGPHAPLDADLRKAPPAPYLRLPEGPGLSTLLPALRAHGDLPGAGLNAVGGCGPAAPPNPQECCRAGFTPSEVLHRSTTW